MSGPRTRSLRFALAPPWMALHLFVLAAATTMVFLGRWQLDVSNSKHFSLQNFGYALQWWAFCAFSLLMWARVLRDAARRADPRADDAKDAAQPAQDSVAYRRYVMPQSATSVPPEADAEHASYNDYLARLARGAQTTEGQSIEGHGIKGHRTGNRETGDRGNLAERRSE